MKVVLFGGSLNPPTDAHVASGRQLAAKFDRVVVIPCGSRPDKWHTGIVDPAHRANMTRLAFSRPKCPANLEVDVSDLERDVFMTTSDLDALWKNLLGSEWEVWHAIGSDLLELDGDGRTVIQREWHEGERIWRELNFAVLPRPGHPVREENLPARRVVLDPLDMDHSSTTARGAFARGRTECSGVPKAVSDYVLRYGLYPAAPGMRRQGRLVLPRNPCLRVITVGGDNAERARLLAAPLLSFATDGVPDAVVAVGGDGHMLDVINGTEPGIPIIGMNAGNVGFLLNELDGETLRRHIEEGLPLDVHLLPKLEVEMDILLSDGDVVTRREHGFNDAWLERGSLQTAWLRVSVQNGTRHEFDLSCDTVVVCTPAGSTAYAYSIGATPLYLDTPMMNMAASAVSRPHGWRSAMIPDDAVVTFRITKPDKRPMVAVVDGRRVGICLRMTVRRSRTANAELAFLPGRSLGAKIAALQFPQ